MTMIAKKIILSGIILLMSLYLHGYFVFNTSCEAFINGECVEESGERLALADGAGTLIVNGAGAFLQSVGHYQRFLEKVELSGMDGSNPGELLGLIADALAAMERANDTYYRLVQVSYSLDYDPAVIGKLRSFDYARYRAVNQLNPSVFREVELRLKNGDVRGCYRTFYAYTMDILTRLNGMKSLLESGAVPAIPSCWRLNQRYLEAELFGQYMAEVFIALK
jgi:hypothetical protein